MKNKIELWHIVGVILAIAILSQYGGDIFAIFQPSRQSGYVQYAGELHSQYDGDWVNDAENFLDISMTSRIFEYEIVTQKSSTRVDEDGHVIRACYGHYKIYKNGNLIAEYPTNSSQGFEYGGTWWTQNSISNQNIPGMEGEALGVDLHQGDTFAYSDCRHIMNSFSYSLPSESFTLDFEPLKDKYVEGAIAKGFVTVNNNFGQSVDAEIKIAYSAATVLGTKSLTKSISVTVPKGTSVYNFTVPTGKHTSNLEVTPSITVLSDPSNFEGVNVQNAKYDNRNQHEKDYWSGVVDIDKYMTYVELGTSTGITQIIDIVGEEEMDGSESESEGTGITFNLPQFPEYTGDISEEEQPSQDVIFNLPDLSHFLPVWNTTAAEAGEPKAQPTGIPNEVFAGILFVLGIIAVLRVKRYI